MLFAFRVTILLCVISLVTDALKDAVCRINRAFVFVKPNAVIPTAISRIKSKLTEVGIDIVEEGSVDAKEIDELEYLDNHYGAIASKAMNFNPNKFEITSIGSQNFKNAFGVDIEDEVKRGNVVSAKIACSKLGISESDLGSRWSSLKFGEELVKLGGGFYSGKIDGVYVINGFYMAMRALYVTPPASIVWMCVEWPESKLSWKSFRSDVVGATDPSRATDSSIRKILFNEWKQLGIDHQPSMAENGFHASASPFEALLERMNWLERKIEDDVFGKELLIAGVSKEMINVLKNDPNVLADGGSLNLIDYLEDMSATECIDSLHSHMVPSAN